MLKIILQRTVESHLLSKQLLAFLVEFSYEGALAQCTYFYINMYLFSDESGTYPKIRVLKNHQIWQKILVGKLPIYTWGFPVSVISTAC